MVDLKDLIKNKTTRDETDPPEQGDRHPDEGTHEDGARQEEETSPATAPNKKRN